MKANELLELKDEELTARLEELRAERFNLRFRSATESIDNPMRFRSIRRDIARIQTVQRQRAGQGSKAS